MTISVGGDISLETTPRVTVIIAAYNCSHTLKCALTTVLGQSYPDFEVLVIGDCCTDDSEQVVAAFDDPRVHWFNLPQRVGSQSGPNNEGLRRARGDCIAYLGQDDLWFPWHLESLLATLDETKADCVNSLIAVMRPGRSAEGCAAPGANLTQGRSIPPSCWLHRREIIEKCGLWPLPRRLSLCGYGSALRDQISIPRLESLRSFGDEPAAVLSRPHAEGFEPPAPGGSHRDCCRGGPPTRAPRFKGPLHVVAPDALLARRGWLRPGAVAFQCVSGMERATMAPSRHSPARHFPAAIAAGPSQCTWGISSFIEKTFLKSTSYGKT
jgi:hypothetical protein